MRAAGCVVGLVVFATCDIALADDVHPTKEVITRDLHTYYDGERTSAIIVAILGALSVGGGVALVTQSSDLARGLGWPLVVLGGLEGIGAVIYAFQVGAEIRHYQAALDHDAGAFRSEELTHMHGTTTRFVFYRLAELGLMLGGIAAASYGFAANVDVWKGIGIGVGSIALPFLIIDTVNNGRASSYTTELKAFDPAPPPRTAVVPLGATPTPFYWSYRGTF
jgi:hypothetical protein